MKDCSKKCKLIIFPKIGAISKCKRCGSLWARVNTEFGPAWERKSGGKVGEKR